MRYAKTAAVGLLALMCLYTVSRVVLNRRVGGDVPAAKQTAEDFIRALRDERYDDALALTSAAYGRKTGREGLAQLVRDHPPFHNRAEPGATGLTSERLERRGTQAVMLPRVQGVPKRMEDYLPITVSLSVGNDGRWRVDGVKVYP